jgi:hypothetical protein
VKRLRFALGRCGELAHLLLSHRGQGMA